MKHMDIKKPLDEGWTSWDDPCLYDLGMDTVSINLEAQPSMRGGFISKAYKTQNISVCDNLPRIYRKEISDEADESGV